LNINFLFGILMVFLAILTAISRVMVGVHYPSDILGAWVIALTLHFLGVNFLI
jgi:undecaprenyl-diphosphatase